MMATIAVSPPVSRIFIRCDGSPALGLGHVMRCLALADELRDVHRCDVTFVMRRGPLGAEMVREQGYDVLTPDLEKEAGDPQWFLDDLLRSCPNAIVCDVRDDLPTTALERARAKGILTVVLDDISARCLSADLAFFPPIPQLQRIDWSRSVGRAFIGWEWVVLRRDLLGHRHKTRRARPFVVVTMGGSDPKGFTLKAMGALKHVTRDCDVTIVLGRGVRHREAVIKLARSIRRPIAIRSDVCDFPALLVQADLAVTAYGNTCYELAVLRVPALIVCLTDDHAESASIFSKSGLGESLGVGDAITEEYLARKIDETLARLADQIANGDTHPPIVDGLGASRVAAVVVKHIEEKRRAPAVA